MREGKKCSATEENIDIYYLSVRISNKKYFNEPNKYFVGVDL
jgi:hypothetical protein